MDFNSWECREGVAGGRTDLSRGTGRKWTRCGQKVAEAVAGRGWIVVPEGPGGDGVADTGRGSFHGEGCRSFVT